MNDLLRFMSSRRRISPADLLVSGSVAALATWWWHRSPLGGLLFGVLAGLLLLARRHRPLVVLGSVMVLTVLTASVEVDGTKLHEGMLLLTVGIAMYAAVVHAATRRGVIAGGLGGLLFASLLLSAHPNTDAGWQPIRLGDLVHNAATMLGFAAVIGVAGLTVRFTRERVRSTERERDHVARIAVAEERTQIARELHDIVAHSLSVIVLQANGAAYAFDHDPARAREALRTIGATGSDALEEIRQLVELLRGAGDGPFDRNPVALDQIGAVVQRARDAGLTAELIIDGTPPEVPSAVALAFYRIVQESLTNTLKHAGPAPTATVRVQNRPDFIQIDVTDTGTTIDMENYSGHGLIGMRERVSLHGGSFDAGPDPDGGWRVHARIPLSADRKVPA
ncbi:two-component sensor histidine kinase [Winogradskya humida]|uniref:histidine kinase n=2 Tax=Winogradskya humida TaxID=113566 RepID=A0ABQ4A6L3_9ACTN|nr:two-component sensor histidine kinase [Actinoplanes humidus]